MKEVSQPKTRVSCRFVLAPKARPLLHLGSDPVLCAAADAIVDSTRDGLLS